MSLYKKYQAKDIPINEVIDYMSGNSGLTEEFIYQQSQKKGKRYVVLSSSTEEDTKMGEIPMCQINDKPLKVFDNKEGLLVIRNGNAGTTKYLPKGDYTINDHAYILFMKENCPHKINLKWLSIQYKDDFLSYASSSDNGTWNMVIDYMSGNSGLTEEFIYKKTQYKNMEYAVLASSEEHRIVGYLPMCEINGKPLKVFKDKEGLFVIRKGKAGKTRTLNSGKYTINEDVYILFVKENCPHKINLKWLSIQYKDDFLSYASSSDNGTWNMTGFFKNVIIDIPDHNEQMEIVREYEALEAKDGILRDIQDKIKEIAMKSFA
ncbi:hypothetical protein HYW19_04145 [Candidatus Woesearchaeota archaeon]|nr:hypothetical protein [Candidatus Woesearchaeota archaeon]